MMSHKIREFTGSNADYTDCINLYNKAWPEYRRSEKVFRFNDSSRNPKYLFKRLLLEQDQCLVGYVEYMEEWESEEDGDYFAMFSVDPKASFASTADSLLAAIVTDIRSLNGTRLSTIAIEDRVEEKSYLETNGFTFTMREPRSELDVNTFDFSRFAQLEDKLTAGGVEITNLSNLKDRFPDWQRRAYDLEWPIVQDIPTPFPVKREPFEDFIKLFDHPNYMPESDFYALEGDQWVGLANVRRIDGDPKHMTVGLTGILPSHRRRGIATALKIKTVEFAQQYGAKLIRTDNEENNPMYGLNLQLGFEPKPAMLNYELKLD
ncbi:MAG: GNAT superfamily N-acetyltransferase [Cellvibrionaceae bacterium]|jgi:GNAT superfamily N-acetyltransferase